LTGFIPKTLGYLFLDIPVRPLNLTVVPEVAVTGITYDSRQIQPGNIFVAVEGMNVDGHHFIPTAIQNGATAVVGSQPLTNLAVPYIQVSDTRNTLAHLSAAFYGFPARRMTVIGVTGTDGKTTTSSMIYQILLKADLWAGMISTVNAYIGNDVLDTGFHVTTPEAPEIQRYLARMQAAGLTHVVLESTSHGLVQDRVASCEFDLAVITNVTHEHLDFHGTYENYVAAKGRLFQSLAETREKTHGNLRRSILNRDDASFDYLSAICPPEKVSYGLETAGVDYWAEDIQNTPSGQQFVICGAQVRLPVNTTLVGRFNISNALAAFSATVAGLGIDPAIAAASLSEFAGVPGRMERINLGQDFTAVVDFAHTPNALKNALSTARELTAGRVIAVFGSAGLRDRQKRRMMAETSIQLADYSILTAEDPRTEALDSILGEMADAARQAGGVEGKSFACIPDRGEAITLAVQMARQGDIVIACGKGHEQSMCFGTTEYRWDDRIALRSALARRLSITGPVMPRLPTS
jgi:UDP-N-acetylmuramoyl-L-alanyl-D-glutamate--2,6-diaminopimelate ligase